jgi:hypothetical protein
VGIVGLSASGGLSIVAAGQPGLRDRIHFINSFGSYDDARSLLLDVASRSIDVDGQIQDWQPEVRTVEVVAIALIDALDNSLDHEILERVFVKHGSADPADRAALSPPGTDLYELLAGTTRERARAIVEHLPDAMTQRLTRISPSAYLSQVRAHLYLMHDRDDTFIPFTQSRVLAAGAPTGVVQRYTEFSIFAHVIPDRPVPWQTFLPDLWRLFWHVHAVLLELL